MADQSHLDQRYFIDRHIYNCPFCNRRHVTYYVRDYFSFDWSENKKCFVYLVECQSCDKTSMHLSYSQIKTRNCGSDGRGMFYQFTEDENLDDLFFYSVPTSFFVLDTRIPKILRELVTEAEGSLKSNFLTGASACARKVVYELGVLQKAPGANYEERIKALKSVNPNVDPAYFDTLLTIQQVTSTKVHEESYDGWESKHLRLILSTLMEILREIYVVPLVREERRKAILDLKEEVIGGKIKTKTTET
jgi:hypothetical protein